MEDFNISNLVSKEYQDKLTNYHKTSKVPWGGGLEGKVKFIHSYALEYNCNSILDYGAGSSYFIKEINIQYPNHPFIINEYEPGRKELAKDPPSSDMTVCLDVLEHIEPEKLDNVLKHINDKTNKIMYFSACLVPSFGSFSDGGNLHLIIEDKDWWLEKLSKFFTFRDINITSAHVWGLAIKNNL